MALPNIFTPEVVNIIIQRINNLSATTQPEWGKMNVSQMLAHCNVTYELTFEDKHPKPNFLMRFMLRNFVKNMVVGEKPYKKNLRTAPVFLISSEKDFNDEKNRLLSYLQKTLEAGEATFDGRENHGFGKLSAIEWNNLFYKHLGHHLSQFGV